MSEVRDSHIDEFLAERAWLFELSLEPMVVAGFDGHLHTVNAAFQRLLGFDLAELLRLPFLQLIHPEDRAAAADGLERLQEGGAVRDIELRMRRRDGTFPAVSWTATSSLSEGLFYAVGRDVTTRKEAEDRIRRQAELLELAHDAILVRGPGGRVEYWNRGAEELYGWSRAEALGRSSQELLQTQFPEPVGEIEAQVEQAGVWEGELRHRCRDGRWIVVLSRWAVRPDEGRDGVSMLEINRDITARKEAEERLGAHAEALARSNADLEQFAYVASHDLSEPLAVISAYAELLSDGGAGRLSETGQEFVGHILRSANQLRGLIEDLLTYSRLGPAELRRETVDVNALVEGVLEKLGGVRDADVVVGDLPVVDADATQLAQVFQNLIQNAIAFARPGVRPRVVVEGGRDPGGGRWLFSVTDNGIGVAPESRDRIFKMFERLNRRPEAPGTGIGLAICARVVQRHGGRIWVEDAPGGGSRFCFTLPAPPPG